MILSRRRVLTLGVLATLIIGTAIGSHRFGSLTPPTDASAEALLEKAERMRRRRPSHSLEANQSSTDPQAEASTDAKSNRREFTLYRNASGEIVCREATPDEIREREKADLTRLGLRQINHPEFDRSITAQTPAATNLVIILRATQQLDQNADAKNAFNRAAQNWENVIMSPVTIYIDVDLGPTNFGQAWPAGVLGSTRAASSSYPYSAVRANLIAEADGEGNVSKQAIFNALPATTVTTDLGDASAVDVTDPVARAIGLLPATAQSTDTAARIAFNSNNSFDFDPGDGISPNTIDFDAVATHEIGHALGFDSDAGQNSPKPSVWDLYRFRTGTTTSSFATAQRILTVGGAPDPLQYDFIPGNPELGLSNGGPTGSSANGGDGWQSSHWKHVLTCGGTIGIMDPAIPDGCRRTITSNDVLALGSFGYNLTNSAPPPPPPPTPTPPPNDNFANAQAISGCSGSASGSTFGATSEAGEPSHDPSDSTSLSPSHTIWYQWQAPSSGSTTITTSGSDFDTILAVYTGSSVGSLTQIVFNDDVQDGVIRTSSVTFTATAGTIYSIAIDGWGGDRGTVKLNWIGCGLPTPTPTPPASPTPPPNCTTALTVNDSGDLGDAHPGDGICANSAGKCTLRAAIEEANSSPSACGTIYIFFSGVASPITLASALPDINHNIEINGPGANALTIQRSSQAGTPSFRVFTIGNLMTVRIFGLTITNGSISANSGTAGSGGGIYNHGALTISASVISNNSAQEGGGIYHSGSSLSIVGTSIVGNVTTGGGGGIEGGSSSGLYLLRDSTIANNTAATLGGGVIVNGPILNGQAFIVNTTISSNVAESGSGGGILIPGSNDSTFTLNVTNSTITANRESSAVPSFNGGGISKVGGILRLRNTIVAGNFRGTGTTADDIPDPVDTTSSFNLIGTGGAGGLTNGTNGNKVGIANPVLGPLANNGGLTMTHALLSGSPAIDAGSNALALDQGNNPLGTDQRQTGFPRIVNGTVDIGAFEAAPAPSPTPTPSPTPAPGINQIVISQIYMGGGTTGAPYKTSFIEVFNRGSNTVNLNSWIYWFGPENGPVSIGLSFSRVNGILIPPRRYLLLELAAVSGSGSSLPTPDLSTNQFTGSGKVFLSRPGVTTFPGNCPLPNTAISDFVGYGANPTCFEGAGPAGALPNTMALIRKQAGCTDTDNNANDFVIGPPTPRNSSSPANPCAPNPIDDPTVFVKQQYLDFLNRQPDQSGWDFWNNQIVSCGANAACADVARINTSGAFFLSIEFQQTGNLVYKMYKAAFGDLPDKPVAVERAPFIADTRQIQSTPAQVIVGQPNWQAQLETNKQAFALAFVQRASFQMTHTEATADAYVNALFTNTGATPTAAEVTAAINAFNSSGGGDGGRAAALRSVCESNSVSTKLFNEAFVLMQYFGYLQRNPYDPPEPTLDYQGYNFWLNKLNQFNGDYLAAEMVKAFISSTEYRQRFGP